jgi:hypothetical protein
VARADGAGSSSGATGVAHVFVGRGRRSAQPIGGPAPPVVVGLRAVGGDGKQTSAQAWWPGSGTRRTRRDGCRPRPLVTPRPHARRRRHGRKSPWHPQRDRHRSPVPPCREQGGPRGRVGVASPVPRGFRHPGFTGPALTPGRPIAPRRSAAPFHGAFRNLGIAPALTPGDLPPIIEHPPNPVRRGVSRPGGLVASWEDRGKPPCPGHPSTIHTFESIRSYD